MNLVETLRGQGTFVCVTPEQLTEMKKENGCQSACILYYGNEITGLS